MQTILNDEAGLASEFVFLSLPVSVSLSVPAVVLISGVLLPVGLDSDGRGSCSDHGEGNSPGQSWSSERLHRLETILGHLLHRGETH